jgi:hypothetical protein
LVQGGALPPNAEGLVIQSAAKGAIVLLDGDKGKDDCATAAQQLTVMLPCTNLARISVTYMAW